MEDCIQGVVPPGAGGDGPEEQQILQASRQQEMTEWLERQQMKFTEYNDTYTRRFAEKITAVDAETIPVKIRDADVEIEQKLC